MEHFSFHAALRPNPLMETGQLIKWFVYVALTGSSSSGAFPERVLEGNFSQVLSHFLSFVCVVEGWIEMTTHTKTIKNALNLLE